MRRNAAAGCEDAFRGEHALEIVRAGFGTAQDDLAPAFRFGVGVFRCEHDSAAGGAGAGRQAVGQWLGIGKRRGVEHRREQRVDGVGGNLGQRGLAVEQTFVVHFHRDAHGRQAGAFAVARLQHVELVVLDGELEVLHVEEVRFELGAHALQFIVDRRHVAGQFGDGLRRAHPGHHIFALGIDQVLAVKCFFAAGRIAGEGDAGGAIGAAVAEYHGLDVDRGAP